MIVDLVSQMKTLNLMSSLLQGSFERCTPYPFVPFTEQQLPDRELYGLEKSTPEAQGVESAWLNSFFCTLRDCSSIHIHSAAVLRHGKLLAEGSFKPYTAAYPHMQFSLSKSVVGMAVGIAVNEGLLSVDDRLIDFFDDDKSLFKNLKLAGVTVKTLLQMTAGVKYNEVFSVTDRDWVRGFLASECAFTPGTDFYYNSMNSYMLSAVLHKVTGVSLVKYLTPRLFEPLGIPKVRWDCCPMGTEKGGWGLYLRSVDMLKLGQLYLQHGRWQCSDGIKQLVPEQWVKESTENFVKTDDGCRDGGYGYQLWSFPGEKAFQYSGVYGQHVIVLPKLDAVVAITSGSQTFVSDSSSDITAKYFADNAAGFHEKPLPPDIKALRTLRKTLSSLYAVSETAPEQPKASKNPFSFLHSENLSLQLKPVPKAAENFEGLNCIFEPGCGSLMPLPMQIFTNNFVAPVTEASFSFTPGMCHITFKSGTESCKISAGLESEPFRCVLNFGGEQYPVGSSAKLTTDEDGRPVLKLFISFLQAPFTRIIKFILYSKGKKVLARFNEQPSVSETIEMMMNVMGDGTLSRFNDMVSQQKLRGRLSELSMPKMHGIPTKQEDSES